MNILYFLYIPSVTALLTLLIPRKLKFLQELITILGSIVFLGYAVQSLFMAEQFLNISWFQVSVIEFSFEFRLYQFSAFLLLFLGIFTLFAAMYSTGYFRNLKLSHLYFPFIQLTLASSAAIVLADNLFVLLLGWEVVTLLLFYLISMGQGKSAAMAAGKTFAILGFTDVALLLAVFTIPIIYGTWTISNLHIALSDTAGIILFFLMFVAAIAKAGAMPFHSWIPPAAISGPLPAIAFLPASLDKLLGVYLLARICLDIFIIPTGSTIGIIIMVIGSITILSAVLLQIMQNELKSLLSYCAITQMGYILLGIGSGHPIGIAGGLFHMLNHAIYKGCLFYSIGAVEQKTGTTDLDKLGGLARTMPITFISCLIAALAVSGIPPLNGFVSKWMIYQGLAGGKSIWNMIFLVIAMFGSALTLASFLKVIYGVFLGHGSKDTKLPSLEKPADMYNDVSWWMLTPMIFLATLCIFFGLYAYLPISFFIAPIINLDVTGFSQTISIGTAIWNPTLATALIFVGLIIGAILYYISRIKMRTVESIFIGGEKYDLGTEKTLASNLFESIEKIKFLGGFIRESSKGIFDIYNISGDLGLLGVNVLKKLHDGILSTYLAWCIIGLGILCFDF